MQLLLVLYTKFFSGCCRLCFYIANKLADRGWFFVREQEPRTKNIYRHKGLMVMLLVDNAKIEEAG